MLNELKNLWMELGKKIDGLKSAPASDELTALKTNLSELGGKITTELNQAISDLATARQTIGTLETSKTDLAAKLETAQGQVNSHGANLAGINTALDEAITTFKLDVKADAPGKDKITALKGAVVNVLARHGIDASALPSGQPSGGGQPGNAKLLQEFAAIADPTLRTQFYRKNKDAIDAAHRL